MSALDGLRTPEEMQAALGKFGGGTPQQQPNTTGSPALAGQDPSITGQAASLPHQTSLPSSASGGNAPDPRTPVGNGANEPQAGEGNLDTQGGGNTPIDMTPDRGNGTEFQQALMIDFGSQRTYEQAKKSGGLVRRNLGNYAKDPEMAKLISGRFADSWGMTDDKHGEAVMQAVQEQHLAQLDHTVDGEVLNKTLTAQQGKKIKKKYRGVFAGMSREEFSMFLWDWGASMMANGKQGWGSVGQAGSDAMGAHRARISEDQEAGIAAQTLKHTQGIATDRVAISRQQAETSAQQADTAALTARSKTINTDKGVFQLNPETGEYDIQIKDEKGNNVMPSALSGRPSTKDWEIKAWMEAYPEMTKQEATARALSGVDPEEAKQDARQEFNDQFKTGEIFVPGEGRVRARDITPAHRKKFIDEYTRSGRIPGQKERPALSGGATNTGGGKLTREQYVDGGGSESEYDEYSDLYDKYGN